MVGFVSEPSFLPSLSDLSNLGRTYSRTGCSPSGSVQAKPGLSAARPAAANSNSAERECFMVGFGGQDLLKTNLCGLPVPSGPPAGRQRTTSSFFLATSKSLSVIPPAEWVFNLTHSLPQVTDRSAWW